MARYFIRRGVSLERVGRVLNIPFVITMFSLSPASPYFSDGPYSVEGLFIFFLFL